MGKKKVLIAGTFDILHPGHIFLINEAAKLGEVYIIVATDKNRKRFSGELPIIPEEQRLEMMKSLKNVKEAKLGSKDINTLSIISEINPDIILLGPNQEVDINNLKKALKEKSLSRIKIKKLNQLYNKYELNSSSSIKKKIFELKNRNKKIVMKETHYPLIFGKM
ncbi:MAG: adenylyltransferase/cytidyltransferase family protein [Promethearchaeota archaeon]